MRHPFLVMDASTYRGTVAVVDGSRVLAEREVQMRGQQEERLMPAVAETLVAAGVRSSDVEGVVCGAGPGSFTSLRIAGSIGKGIAAAAQVPLYAVSSILLLVAGATPAAQPGRYLGVLDAMRGAVFAGRVLVGEAGLVEQEGEVDLLDSAAASRRAADEGRQMVGPGVGPGWSPHARGFARLRLVDGALQAVDLASWEPSYGRLAEAQVQWEQKHGRSLLA